MRTMFRLLLVGSLLIAATAAAVSLWKLGFIDPSAWATVAAVLAVIAAAASAWTGQRVLELQEDAQEPNPVPVIDLRSRYMLAQFRITNHGGASAHDVKITWQQQLQDAQGKDVLLGRDIAIPVIPEGESASVLLGGSHEFFKKQQDTTCRGTIRYTNASGRRYTKPFVVSVEHERIALADSEETAKTLWELQKVPDKIERVAREIERLGGVLDRDVPPAPSSAESRDHKPGATLSADDEIRNETETNKLLFRAYLLGQQILYRTVDMPKIKAADDRIWDLLQDIADGKSTLVESAEDMLLNTPVAPHRVEEIKEYLARATPKVIEHEREMARRILEGANQSL